MKRIATSLLCLLVALSLGVNPASAQLLFRKALQEKHESLKIVSCNTCHVAGEEKTVRNDFGMLIAKELEGKKATDRINAAKDLDDDAKAKEYDAVTKDFLEALKKVEEMKSESGKSYGELIESGELEGVTLK